MVRPALKVLVRPTPAKTKFGALLMPAKPKPVQVHAKPKTEKTERVVVEKEKERPAKEIDPLDPETRRYAQLGPPPQTLLQPIEGAAQPLTETVAPKARVSMEELLPELVKRIAWAGDKRKGTVQLELGSGPYAGAVVTVHAEEGKVRVGVEGRNAAELEERIRRRLTSAEMI